MHHEFPVVPKEGQRAESTQNPSIAYRQQHWTASWVYKFSRKCSPTDIYKFPEFSINHHYIDCIYIVKGANQTDTCINISCGNEQELGTEI